MRSEQRAR